MVSWPTIARRIRVPLGFAFALLYIWLARPTAISMLPGAVLIATGVTIRALASGHVSKNEKLATSGPYAYTRNPLYLGSLILAIGFAVAGRSWWIAAIVAIFFAVVYLPVIRGEEALLRQRFPEFDQYTKEVPRLLPRLRRRAPLPGPDNGAFSWELYFKHREYNALVGAAAMMAGLAIKMLWRK
jgi:protein-S-isoprenylcysteine O-methyltransferase Ste14